MNETIKRSISGVVYIVLLLFSILRPESFFILFGVFLLIATIEFCNLLNIQKTIPFALAFTTYVLFYEISIATDGYLHVLRFNKTFDLIVLFSTLFVSIKCIHFLFDNKIVKIDSFSKYTYLIGYIILPFAIMTKIPFGKDGYNPKILISIFILIWTNDSFAYIVGKSIGKTKLFARISPKKTIEGFVGGVLFSVIASYLVSKYYIEIAEGKTFIWIIIALIVGVFGTIGDLIESKFKRIAGVKDSGKIMPGHGGVLDRLDSVIFVAPIIFLFYQILNYVS
ncbi:MAG: phosphatidate cytidylyltransferase [Flavobacterium sp.]|jgi:phosphatidate cytidylyltransferase